MTPFRFVPHTADVAAELVAEDESGLRQAGVDALRALLVGESEVAIRDERVIQLRGPGPSDRLIHFLQDVLYFYDVERFLPARATARGIAGEPFDATRHEARPEVKAVTYHGAEIRRGDDGLLHVIIVFDV